MSSSVGVVNVPGHETDSLLDASDTVPKKKRLYAIIENKSKIPINIKGAVIKVGGKGKIRDWQVVRHDGVVRQWLQASAIEVVEEGEIEEVAPKVA